MTAAPVTATSIPDTSPQNMLPVRSPGVGDVSKFYLPRPPRPMLSRDADSVYWLSRYVERSEHVARIMLVNSNLLTDVGELDPELQIEQWQSVMTILRLDHINIPTDGSIAGQITKILAFDQSNPSSLVTCLSRARENARGIRENISAEMWESLNMLYWYVCADDAPARFEESPEDFYRHIMTGSLTFQGLTDQTLPHEQPWLFTQLAKYLERIDVTARVIETKFDILRAAEEFMETPLKNIHWMAVLRTCCSIEAYRRDSLGDLDPFRVASFLILERDFPRSIRYCVRMAHDAISAIRAETNPTAIDSAERVLGRLAAQLEYAEMSEVLKEGMPSYLQKIQSGVAEAALAVQKSYFLH